jgi:hypothetical protein
VRTNQICLIYLNGDQRKVDISSDTVYIPQKKKYVHFFGACSIHYILYYRLHMFLTFGIQVNKGKRTNQICLIYLNGDQRKVDISSENKSNMSNNSTMNSSNSLQYTPLTSTPGLNSTEKKIRPFFRRMLNTLYIILSPAHVPDVWYTSK